MYRVGGPRETDTTVLKTANMYTLMERKNRHTKQTEYAMYTRHHTVSSTATQTQLGNVKSRVTPHRAIVTAPPSVHWSAQQEVPSMNTNSGGAHHQRNCCRRYGSSNTDVASATAETRRRGSYDTAVGSRSCPSAPRVALCHLQHHGTPFTRDKTPYQSATSPFDDQNVPSTSICPSHEIGRHVCYYRPLLTDC